MSAILLHFMHNSAQNLVMPLSDRTFLVSNLLLVLAAIVVLFNWGAKTLTRQQE